MKRFFVIALFVLGFGQLYAQPVRDTAWTKAGYFGLKLTQVSLSSWSAGGESALAFDSQITYSADFKRDRQLWQNRLPVFTVQTLPMQVFCRLHLKMRPITTPLTKWMNWNCRISVLRLPTAAKSF